MEVIAQLSFNNKDHLLFFRGQNFDYLNKVGSSTFYPSIYRGDYLLLKELNHRFDILQGACKELVFLFEQENIEGFKEVKRRKLIQWSILQHYEVCDTPLLDFTHSLRVACSFAMLNNDNTHAYIFVFGLPYLTNRISTNSEHELINIRLLSICPPNALRPYFQEGYLAGTDDITDNYEDKSELDFNKRLIAKFKIPNTKEFWGPDFNMIPKDSLYPKKDEIFDLCSRIKQSTIRELKSGDLGEFLKTWAEFEELIITSAQPQNGRFLTTREATQTLFLSNKLSKDQSLTINRLRNFRNTLVHTPKQISSKEVEYYLNLLMITLTQLKMSLNN